MAQTKQNSYCCVVSGWACAVWTSLLGWWLKFLLLSVELSSLLHWHRPSSQGRKPKLSGETCSRKAGSSTLSRMSLLDWVGGLVKRKPRTILMEMFSSVWLSFPSRGCRSCGAGELSPWFSCLEPLSWGHAPPGWILVLAWSTLLGWGWRFPQHAVAEGR